VTTSVRTAPSPRRPLVIENVSKTYGDGRSRVAALDRITLSVADREFVCLVGASGCGKTTLLNLLAGIYHLDHGVIDTGGRRIGMVFQEPALFPWLTVSRNIELAMRLRGVPAASRAPRIRDFLGLVHLEGFGDRRPHELSGGMQQRVALARALAQEADLLLMDEPFGALDAITRSDLQSAFAALRQRLALTTLLVTHDLLEAGRIADQLIVMRAGRVEQQGTLDALRTSPATAYVASLLERALAPMGASA